MRYEDMINGIKQDMEVPEDVRVKFEQALANLPEPKKEKKNHFAKWGKMAASAAAAVLVVSGICVANPALAAKLPIIGSIFAQVEEKVTFKGDYSSRSEILTTEQAETESAEAGEEMKETAAEEAKAAAEVSADTENVAAEKNVPEADAKGSSAAAAEEEMFGYSVTDHGIGITASEVYCDGISIFLTAKITVDEGRLTHIPGYQYQLEHNIEDESLTMYARGSWSIEGEKKETELENDNFEGMVLDDNTFIGMLKLDLDTMKNTKGTLKLSLTRIGYDDDERMDSEDIMESHRVDGTWEFEIPFHIDDEQVKEAAIEKRLDNGYAIEKVVVSPYQLVVYADAPYLEEYDSYDFCGAAVYDAQQKPLSPSDEIIPTKANGSVDPDGMVKFVFPLQGRDVSDATVYLFDDFDSYVDSQKGDLETAKEQAVLSADVSF